MAIQGIKITDLPDKSTINVTEPNNYIILTTDAGTLKLPLNTLFYSISSAISNSFKIQNFLVNDCIKKEHIKDGEVTTTELESSINTKLNNISVPVGCIMTFANISAPDGWLICDGSTIGSSGNVQGVNASVLQTLRTYLGTRFGNTGQLPDLRGYFVRGYGTNSDNTSSGSFGVKKQDSIKSHSHSINAKIERYQITTNVYGKKNKVVGTTTTTINGGGGGIVGSSDRSPSAVAASTYDSKTSTETIPKNIALLYCIKY